MLTPQNPEPNKWGDLSGPSFNRANGKLDASALAPGDQNAQAQFIVDALPLVDRNEWKLLTRSSKELLNSAGLIARQKPGWRYYATNACENLQGLIATLPLDAKLLGARALLLLTERFGPEVAGVSIGHLRSLATWFHEKSPAPDNATVDAYRKLVLALLEERNLEQRAFDGGSLAEVLGRRLSRVKLESQLVRYVASQDPEEQRATREYLHQDGGHNDLPFLDGAQFREARRAVKDKAISTALRGYKYAFNFDRFSGETRRAGPGSNSVLANFGVDCFEDCRAVFGTAIERTPGRGCYLSAPSMEKLFFPKFLKDGTYARGYAHYGNALEQFPDASFFFLRGAIVVHHPSLDYCLPVGPAVPVQRKERYTLFIANNHFSGGYDLVALIPVVVLKNYLMPCLQSLTPTSDDRVPQDISVPGFNVTTLVEACEKAGMPAIMLANISTVFGGSVAGYPKSSQPFYGWEPERERANSLWQDALGRVHHAWYVRGDGLISDEAARKQHYIDLLRPLGEGCHKVANVAKGLFDLLDLFMARYDAWKCDLTPTESLSPRMLAEAYRWHDKLRERNAPADAYPLLCFAHRYDWTRSPEVILDTATLELFLGDGKRMELPPRTRGEGPIERSAWMKYVMPRIADKVGKRDFAEKDSTLVLLPREYVHSSQNDVPLPKL
jgi:hypothetical protein